MKAVIFDFDGTIADTFPYVEEIVNRLAPKYGYKKFTHDEFIGLRDLSLREIVSKYKISYFTLSRMVLDAHKNVATKIDEAKTFTGVRELFEDLHKKGVLVAIVSTNSKQNILRFLTKNNLEVDAVLTSFLPFGKAKKINKFLRNQKISKNDAVYIGDEVRDIEAGQEIGIGVISVTWGYNSAKVLKESNKQVVDTVKELESKLV